MPTTHIMFVGRDKYRLMDSVAQLREVGVSKIVLVVGDDTEFPGEQIVRQVAIELEEELGHFWIVSTAQINKNSVLNAASQILTLINTEKSFGNDVILNASYTLRALSISAYIAACMSKSKFVCALPNRTSEKSCKLKVIEVPVLPINYLRQDQRELLLRIGKGVESIDTLIYEIFPDIDRDAVRFRTERSRMSYQLARLEDDGFITKIKNGRSVSIKLTYLGEILAEAISGSTDSDVYMDETKHAGSLVL